MEHMHCSEIVKVLRELEESAKCCICIEILKPPVLICDNGHAICNGCKGVMVLCPTCKAKFSSMKPVMLNNILSALPILCCNANLGCSRLLTKSTQERHESLCPMRLEPCRIEDCSWNDSISLLYDHIKSEHNDFPIYSETNICFWEEPNLNEHAIDVSFAHAFDCFFWKYECVDIVKHKLLIFVQCIPVSDQTEPNFLSKMCFTKEKSPIEYTFTQKCVYNSKIILDEILEQENCMAVPLDMLALLVNDDGRLNYTFEIIKL